VSSALELQVGEAMKAQKTSSWLYRETSTDMIGGQSVKNYISAIKRFV
jgi:hypothetical protein